MATLAMEPDPEARARVLVVDDDEIVRRCVARLLSGRHDVRAVDGAQAALALFHAGERFDAILCDLRMPGMSGVELRAALVRDAPDQARRFAILTGADTEETEALAGACGCPVVEKPCSREALLACVRALRVA